MYNLPYFFSYIFLHPLTVATPIRIIVRGPELNYNNNNNNNNYYYFNNIIIIKIIVIIVVIIIIIIIINSLDRIEIVVQRKNQIFVISFPRWYNLRKINVSWQ